MVDPLIGKQLGNYVLEEKLGYGGSGVVYRARHAKLGTPFAVKILHPILASNEESAERFLREAQVAARIHHSNVVFIADFDIEPGVGPYFVMEFLDGESLRDLLDREEYLLPPQILRLTRQICHALDAAHHEGITHRDLKPENIYLVRRGDREIVKLLDFGIAKITRGAVKDSENITQNGRIMGTPRYFAPEQAQGNKIDNRSDLYSLGVIIYEMLIGTTPFQGTTPEEMILQHLAYAPPPLVPFGYPQELEDFIHWVLAKNPEERPQDVEELWDSLKRAISLIPDELLKKPDPTTSSRDDLSLLEPEARRSVNQTSGYQPAEEKENEVNRTHLWVSRSSTVSDDFLGVPDEHRSSPASTTDLKVPEKVLQEAGSIDEEEDEPKETAETKPPEFEEEVSEAEPVEGVQTAHEEEEDSSSSESDDSPFEDTMSVEGILSPEDFESTSAEEHSEESITTEGESSDRKVPEDKVPAAPQIALGNEPIGFTEPYLSPMSEVRAEELEPGPASGTLPSIAPQETSLSVDKTSEQDELLVPEEGAPLSPSMEELEAKVNTTSQTDRSALLSAFAAARRVNRKATTTSEVRQVNALVDDYTDETEPPETTAVTPIPVADARAEHTTTPSPMVTESLSERQRELISTVSPLRSSDTQGYPGLPEDHPIHVGEETSLFGLNSPQENTQPQPSEQPRQTEAPVDYAPFPESPEMQYQSTHPVESMQQLVYEPALDVGPLPLPRSLTNEVSPYHPSAANGQMSHLQTIQDANIEPYLNAQLNQGRTTSQSLLEPDFEEPLPRNKSGKGLWIFALLLLVGGGIFLVRQQLPRWRAAKPRPRKVVHTPATLTCLSLMTLNTEPSGAEILKDGKVLGTTPYMYRGQCNKRVTLYFRATGFLMEKRMVFLSEGSNEITFPLRKPGKNAKSGIRLMVYSNPRGVSIFERRKFVCATPCELSAPFKARRRYRLIRKGYRTRNVRITFDKNNSIRRFKLTLRRRRRR